MSKKEPNYFYWGTAIIAIGYSIIYKQFNDIKMEIPLFQYLGYHLSLPPYEMLLFNICGI